MKRTGQDRYDWQHEQDIEHDRQHQKQYFCREDAVTTSPPDPGLTDTDTARCLLQLRSRLEFD